jgi:hypothetical protein
MISDAPPSSAASRILRWSWVARSVVYIGWIGWIVMYVLGGGKYDIWGTPFAADHLAFYAAGRVLWENEVSADRIYDWDGTIRPLQKRILPERWESVVAFRNPPWYALLYWPTSGLPYWWSAFIWELASMAALVLGIHWLAPAQPQRVLVLALGFFPVLCTLVYGQNTLLSFAAFALTYHQLRLGKPFRAGLAAGLLVYKPTLLVGLILWGLVDLRRRWPCAVGILVTTAGLALGSYAIAPMAWEGFISTFRANLDYDTHSLEWWKNVVPQAFWKVLLPPLAPRWISILTWLCSLAGVAWFVLLFRKHRDNLPVIFGAAVAVTLWVNTHALIYEWALLLIPAVLWWEHSGVPRWRWALPFAATWLGLLISVDGCWCQIWLWRRYFPEWPEYAFMTGVPAVAWSGWKTLRILNAPQEAPEAPRQNSPAV